MKTIPDSFQCGVIEGFYGRPWSAEQRRRLFGRMRRWGLNTYLYGPKDDVQHRACWRKPYDSEGARTLRETIQWAHRQGIRYVYALSPGLDLQYSSPRDLKQLLTRFDQLRGLGCRHFAICFDDIPREMSGTDRKRFGALGVAQSHVANAVLAHLRRRGTDAGLLFCPTDYCGRMARPSVANSAYLSDLGRLLDPAVQVFWTGPDIISRTITVPSIREVRAVIRRKPLIWDNLHANDYDRRRVYLGPYVGRPLALRREVGGILVNPNCEYEANYLPLQSLGAYGLAKDRWSPRSVWLAGFRQWMSEWATHGSEEISPSQVELLADACYLPFESGPKARRWIAALERVLDGRSAVDSRESKYVLGVCDALESLFNRMAMLKNRELLHSLLGHVWALNEEASLVRDYLRWLRGGPKAGERYVPTSHVPGLFRGGLLDELQRLLPLGRDGTLPAPTRERRVTRH